MTNPAARCPRPSPRFCDRRGGPPRILGASAPLIPKGFSQTPGNPVPGWAGGTGGRMQPWECRGRPQIWGKRGRKDKRERPRMVRDDPAFCRAEHPPLATPSQVTRSQVSKGFLAEPGFGGMRLWGSWRCKNGCMRSREDPVRGFPAQPEGVRGVILVTRQTGAEASWRTLIGDCGIEGVEARRGRWPSSAAQSWPTVPGALLHLCLYLRPHGSPHTHCALCPQAPSLQTLSDSLPHPKEPAPSASPLPPSHLYIHTHIHTHTTQSIHRMIPFI